MEKHKLIPHYLKTRGIFRHHTDSFNYFVNQSIKDIVGANSMICNDFDPSWYIKFGDVRVGFPEIVEELDHVRTNISPNECRLRNLTYSAPIHVDLEYLTGSTLYQRKNVLIGRLPIMLKSSRCTLHGKSHQQLASLSECPYDPGGYFIVRGVEKVILMQEQMANNRIIVDYDPLSSDTIIAFVFSSTNFIKTRTLVVLKPNNRFFLRHNALSEDIPVSVVFKAMNVYNDQQMMQLVGSEEDFMSFFAASVENSLEITSLTAALDYIGHRVKSNLSGEYASADANANAANPNNKINEGREFVAKLVLPNIECDSPDNLYKKSVMMAQMIRRLIMVKFGQLNVDDRDYYGNKRVECAGSLISILFEDLFKRLVLELKKMGDNQRTRPASKNIDITRYIRHDNITNGLVNSLSSGNWNIKRFNMMRSGVTQVLSRLSYISALGMMTRINSQFEKTRKVSGPRSLQPSQWGMLCPSDTPEGEGCGLIKNLALLTHISIESDESMIIRLCFNLGMMSDVFGDDLINCPVMLNGSLVGQVSHDFCNLFINNFRRVRRMMSFNKNNLYTTSIYYSRELKMVVISSDSGRLCRPLLILQDNQVLLTKKDIELLEQGKIDIDDLVSQGKVEMLDVNEQNDTLIALNFDQMKQAENIAKSYTHMEISEYAILGACAALIPFPHHNQSPRNTYQCAMGKQAMGTIGYNQRNRIDTLMYLLTYPQRPMVATRPLNLINFDKLPAGENCIVAVMSYSGYDIEDALIINSASLDRGLMRCHVYRQCSTTMKRNALNEKIDGPTYYDDPTKNNYRQPIRKHRILEKDGITGVGLIIQEKDVLVNKLTLTNDDKQKEEEQQQQMNQLHYKETPLTFKNLVSNEANLIQSTNTYAEQVMLTTNTLDGSLTIKVLTRQTRRPEVGDKFSSRHGQKGVCGLIVKEVDMPYSIDAGGIRPDIIMNPHGFPSRMTVGKLLELISGKAGVVTGEIRNGTAFEKVDTAQICEMLEKCNYNRYGKEMLVCGITGKVIEAYVYMGPIYYQKLKHMVADKMHARAKGPRAVLTRQPTEGRSREGGLRLGEMERDCLIGYGSSMLLLERLMLSSDAYNANVCSKCGLIGKKGWCQNCRASAHMTVCRMPYACKLLFQELMAMNIAPKMVFEDYIN